MKSIVLMVTLLCAALLVACGPADSTQAPTTPPAGDTPAAATPPTPAAPEAAAPSNADRAAFERTMANYGTAEFNVNYNLKTQVDGKPFTGTLSQFMKGETMFRTDTTAEGVETRTYIVNDKLTTCFKYSGSWSCSEMTAGNAEDQESPNPANDLTEATEDESYVVVRDGTMQVAGVTAECYKITQEGATSRYCIYDSVPLYILTTFEEGSSELTATSYNKRVAASDFTPPATAQEGSAYPMPPGLTMPEGFEMPQ